MVGRHLPKQEARGPRILSPGAFACYRAKDIASQGCPLCRKLQILNISSPPFSSGSSINEKRSSLVAEVLRSMANAII